jgi:hypothetical protein
LTNLLHDLHHIDLMGGGLDVFHILSLYRPFLIRDLLSPGTFSGSIFATSLLFTGRNK